MTLVGGQLQEQVLDHLLNLSHPGLGAVYLVDDHHWGDILPEGLAQHVGRLRHGAVDGVHQQQATVGHVHDAFHFAAEIGVARGIDDVDSDSPVGDGGVLGQDRDAALPFQRIGVHDQLAHLLVGLEHLALHQQRVHQGGLAMVHMGYDCKVAYGVVLIFAQICLHQVR